MSISQGIRKACRIAVGSLWAFLSIVWSLSPLAQHAVDRHIGFWMLWGFYGILLCLWAVSLFMPQTAEAMRWKARIRLLAGGVVIILGCFIALVFEGEGLVMCAFFVAVGLWLLFAAVRVETRAKKKAAENHDA
jgi:hypothetical protein